MRVPNGPASTRARAKTIVLAGLSVAIIASCDSGLGAPAPEELRSDKLRVTSPVVSSADAAQLASDNLALGLDLHARLGAGASGNVVFSQTSVSLALAMLYGGAAGDTATQMATALHFTLPPERLHPAFDALDLALTAPPAGGDAGNFRLSIVNSTWVQRDFSILPSYLDLLAESYGAGLFVEDFTQDPERARATVNGWVSGRTEHLIPELFPAGTITPLTVLVLANTVYFHGDWEQPFQPNSPDGTFHAPSGDVSVPIMAAGLEAPNGSWWSGDGWDAVAIPYKGRLVSMVVVVPAVGTFDTFEQDLTTGDLAALLAPTQTGTALVSLPRFKVDTAARLDETLKAMGMTDAFGPAADFSAIDGARDLYVQAVVHQAVITVDEEGTTAAAATGVTVGRKGAPLVDKVLTVDRPFLFFIRHDPTGAILFQGRVVDPSL